MNPLTPGALVSPAGQTASPSPIPQGNQWFGVAFVAGLFGFLYWGLRAESEQEKLAYTAMKRARR